MNNRPLYFFAQVLVALGVFASFPAFSATPLEQSIIANWDKQMARAKLNAAIAVAETKYDGVAGRTVLNSFGNLTLKPVVTGSTALALYTKGTLVAGGKPLVIDVEAKFVKPSLVGALGRFAGKVIPVLATGVALYDLTQELDKWSVSKGADGKPQFSETIETGVQCLTYVGTPPAHSASYDPYWFGPGGWREEWTCQLSGANYFWGWRVVSGSGALTFEHVQQTTAADGVRVENRTAEQWATKIADDVSALLSPKIANLIRDVISSGEDIELAPKIITGPATTAGPITTTTNSDGSTVTTTTTNNFTYAGDAITHNESKVVNECVGVGACTEITTITEGSPAGPDAIDPTDKAFPPVDRLYEPKYPDGLGGVWNDRKDQMTSTALVGLVGDLMPSLGSSGTCPSWMLPLDLGAWDFGSYDVAPPCWIWDFAKAIVILSALLLARALIFGG